MPPIFRFAVEKQWLVIAVTFFPLVDIGLLHVFHAQLHTGHIVGFVHHKKQGKGNHIYANENRDRI